LQKVRNWLAGKIKRELIFANYYLRELRRSRPDIVHIHFGAPALLLFREIKKLNLPLVTSFYGFDLSQLPYVLGQDVYERSGLFKFGQIFTGEGNVARSRLVELGCPDNKAHLLRIGVDFSKYEYLPRQRKKDEPFRILFCGRFVEKKGLLIAIMSIAKVIELGYSINFNIVGGGPQKEDIENLISELKIETSVKFLGILEHKNFIQECYNNHIMLAPSQTDKITKETEGGAPTVLIEAQSTGMPIIATKHADIPEIVINQGSGILVDEGDVNGICDAIIRLIESPGLIKRMGAYGREHVLNQHNIVIVNKRLENLYDRAIKLNS